MNECYYCGFWDSDYEDCACDSMDRWYACPLEPEPTDEEWENYVHGDEQGQQDGIGFNYADSKDDDTLGATGQIFSESAGQQDEQVKV